MPYKPVTIVVAVAQNGVIGRDNRLPWRLPTDLKHFKSVTMGGAIIMGRKTWESLGGRALPGRQNIVVSSQPHEAEGFVFVRSIGEAISVAQRHEGTGMYLIGGAGLFQEGIGLSDRIILTRVLAEVEGDTYFPELDPSEWTLRELTMLETGPNDEYRCRLEVYERVRG